MARFAKFIVGDKKVTGPNSVVDGYVQKVLGDDGALYLNLFNYAQGGPKPGDSPTQSMHFDYTSAKAFKAILDEVFGVL